VGHVRIYRLEDDGISWELSGEDIDGEAEFDELGTPVSLSANGSTILIGASSYVPESTGYYVKVYRTGDDGGSGYRSVRPSPAMPLRIILGIL
jgi:hypothetical protein